MNSRFYPSLWLILTILVTFLVHWQLLGPILFDDNVVQDDFRQSFFWLWQYADPSLLQKSFYKDMYLSNTIRTPVFQLLFLIYPFFTSNLILYSKLITLFTAILSSLVAYLFFRKLSNDYQLSFVFACFMSIVFWCTDHISAVGQRAFLYFGLFLFMYLKLNGRKTLASLLNLFLLFLSPIAFLICFSMQGLELLFDIFSNKQKTNFIFQKLFKSKDFLLLILNAVCVSFTYLVLFKDLPTQGVGKQFTKVEMKLIPEFNPGGRHPIFGASIWDGTWWTNEHWGLGIGYLKISELLIIAFFLLVFFIITESLSKKSIFKSKLKFLIVSQPAQLFFSSIILYGASQILFPILYMPSRFLGLPLLIVSSILIVLIVNYYICEILQMFIPAKNSSLIFPKLKFAILFFLLFNSWNHYKNFYHPRYVSINPQVRNAIALTPKDSIFAGHPLLPDLNSIEIFCKRAVFADYERSMAYTQKTLDEIRLRNIISLKMVYAKNKEDFISLANQYGITHFLAHYYFYSPEYLNNPVYMKPYDEVLRELTKKNNQQVFYVQTLLDSRHSQYEIIEISKL